MAAVKEVKKEIGNDFTAQQTLTKETVEQMFGELTKGQDIENPQITPEQITAAVLDSIAGIDGADNAALEQFGQALTHFMQSTLERAATQEKKHESPE